MEYLVAVDGSTDSDTAVTHAGRLAAATGGRVRVVHAVAPRAYAAACSPASTGGGRSPDIETAAARGETAVSEAAGRLRADGVTVADTHLLYGDPTEAIPEFARERGVDGIVVGHRGLSTASDRVLGSVAVGLVDRTDVPVTVVG